MRFPAFRTSLSVVLVTCLMVLRLLCVCSDGALARAEAATYSSEHACCSGDMGDSNASPRGAEHHDPSDCSHCGETTLNAAPELKLPVAKSLVDRLPQLIPSVVESTIARLAVSSLAASRESERASWPLDLSVLRQTCILLI